MLKTFRPIRVRKEVTMSLNNFGSILGFAEEIEAQNMTFFTEASLNPACGEYSSLLQDLEKNARKRSREVQRIRRENVSEMILEACEGFHREPFVVLTEDAITHTSLQVIDKVKELLGRSADYYEKAAAALKSQVDVAVALKNLAKKHKKELKKLP